MPNLRILGDNFSIFKCYSSKAGPGPFSGNQRRMTAKLNRRKNTVAVITRLDGYLKRQIKNQTWHTFRLFQLGKLF